MTRESILTEGNLQLVIRHYSRFRAINDEIDKLSKLAECDNLFATIGVSGKNDSEVESSTLYNINKKSIQTALLNTLKTALEAERTEIIELLESYNVNINKEELLITTDKKIGCI